MNDFFHIQYPGAVNHGRISEISQRNSLLKKTSRTSFQWVGNFQELSEGGKKPETSVGIMYHLRGNREKRRQWVVGKADNFHFFFHQKFS